MTEPTYYKTEADSDSLDQSGVNDDELAAYITDERWNDPLDTGDTSDWHNQTVARATPPEHAEWTAAYTTFAAAVKRANDQLETARDAWKQAQGIASAQIREAWQKYEPVHDTITRREEEVEELRTQAENAENARRAQAAIDAQAAEDAELGPRTWVTHCPSGSYAKVSPDMAVPVIHLAGCALTKGVEDVSYRKEYLYARQAEVQDVLLAGGPEKRRGMNTGRTLHTKLCGRCKPEDSLRSALGETFEKWLVEAESVQLPMPTAKGLPAALKLKGQWHDPYTQTDGYSLVSDKYYRAEKLLQEHETLIGWVVHENGRRTVTNRQPDKLDALIAELPARGFAARRVQEPRAYGQNGADESPRAVAVRRMTAHEIRQAKADATATARFHGGGA